MALIVKGEESVTQCFIKDSKQMKNSAYTAQITNGLSAKFKRCVPQLRVCLL